MTDAPNYKVGYGRPPLDSQFQKGRSGNPAGRPKGARGVSAVIAAAMADMVVVTVDGKRRKMSKLQAAFTQQANKAASGDRHAIKLMVELLHHAEAREDARLAGAPVDADQRRETDQAILAAIKASALNIIPEDDDDHSS